MQTVTFSIVKTSAKASQQGSGTEFSKASNHQGAGTGTSKLRSLSSGNVPPNRRVREIHKLAKELEILKREEEELFAKQALLLSKFKEELKEIRGIISEEEYESLVELQSKVYPAVRTHDLMARVTKHPNIAITPRKGQSSLTTVSSSSSSDNDSPCRDAFVKTEPDLSLSSRLSRTPVKQTARTALAEHRTRPSPNKTFTRSNRSPSSTGGHPRELTDLGARIISLDNLSHSKSSQRADESLRLEDLDEMERLERQAYSARDKQMRKIEKMQAFLSQRSGGGLGIGRFERVFSPAEKPRPEERSPEITREQRQQITQDRLARFIQRKQVV